MSMRLQMEIERCMNSHSFPFYRCVESKYILSLSACTLQELMAKKMIPCIDECRCLVEMKVSKMRK
jgi:hypothetical protein